MSWYLLLCGIEANKLLGKIKHGVVIRYVKVRCSRRHHHPRAEQVFRRRLRYPEG